MLLKRRGEKMIIGLFILVMFFGGMFAYGYFYPKPNTSKMSEEQRVLFEKSSWWLSSQEAGVLYNEFSRIPNGKMGLVVGAWLGEPLGALFGAQSVNIEVILEHPGVTKDRKKFLHLLKDSKTGEQLKPEKVFQQLLELGNIRNTEVIEDLEKAPKGEFGVVFADLNETPDLNEDKSFEYLQNGGTFIQHDSLFPGVMNRVIRMALFEKVCNMRQVGTMMLCTKVDKVTKLQRFNNMVFLFSRIPEVFRGTGQLARESKTSTVEWASNYYLK